MDKPRFTIAGTHLQDSEDEDWLPQVDNYGTAKLIRDKLNELTTSKYVISAVYEKKKDWNTTNIQNVIMVVEAENKEEAIGFAILKWSDKYSDYSLFTRPLVVEV